MTRIGLPQIPRAWTGWERYLSSALISPGNA